MVSTFGTSIILNNNFNTSHDNFWYILYSMYNIEDIF